MPEALLVVGEPKYGGSLEKLNKKAKAVVRSADEAQEAFVKWKSAVWIAFAADALREVGRIVGPTRGEKNLIVLGPVDDVLQETTLRTLFRHVISAGKGVVLLSQDELVEVLGDSNRANYFVAGTLDRAAQHVILYRGNIDSVIVPWDWFRQTTSHTAPDFDHFEITDFGQTIKFGAFEASTDAILDDFDPEYRRKARKNAIDQDTSIGGCLRRIRKLKGIAREELSDLVSEKELGRIERGEVTPRPQTLERIAQRLGVTVAELATY